MRFALLGVVLLGLLAGAARAQTGVVAEIGGKQIPLAEGVWLPAGDAAGRLDPDQTLGGFGRIRNMVLLRPSGNRRFAVAMAEINANEIGIDDGWGLAGDCQPAGTVESAILVRGGWDAQCWFVTSRAWDWSADMPPAWQQARAMAKQRGLALPDRTVTVGLRVANRRDIIDLRFHLTETGDEALRDVLPAWATTSVGLLAAGLKHGLPDGRALPSFELSPAALARAGITRERVARLEALVAQGALTQDEARRQEAALRDTSANPEVWAFDPATVEGMRWVSLQGASALSNAVLTFVWTAQSLQAATLTLAQTGAISARSYLTNLFWNQVSKQETRPDAARVVDFAYGGSKPPD